MAEETAHPKASLVNPNLEGLWSVSWIGRSNAVHHKVWGFCCSFLWVGSWFFGITTPLWLSLLLYLRWYQAAASVVAVIAYSFVVDMKGWPFGVLTFLLPAVYWFEGGCSQCYEQPPEGFENECTDDVSKQTPTIHCAHPHGVFSQGFVLNAGFRLYTVLNAFEENDAEMREYYCGKRFTDRRDVFGPVSAFLGVTADAMKYLPFWRAVAGWTQCATSSSKKAIAAMMQKRVSFGLIPGGFFEASLTQHSKEQIYIKDVKGFIKYALRFGYRVIPCYAFGETHTYYNLLNLAGCGRLKNWLNSKRLPTVVPFGKWFCPIVPLNNGVGIHSICGYGKRLPHIPEPTQADIDEWHAWYVAEIRALFDRNKHRFGIDDEQLVVC